MMQMFMMLAEITPEKKLLEELKEAINDYEKKVIMGGGIKEEKNKLIFHLHLVMLKFKPEDMSTPELMKKYQEHEEWMKLKPKDQ